MGSMYSCFRLRLRLFSRLLLELGWWRLLLLSVMLLAVSSKALLTAAQHPVGHWAVPGVGAWLCVSAHRRRADLVFLQIAAPNYRRWLAVEYVALLSPAAIVLLVYGWWAAAALTLMLPALAAWVPAATTTARRRNHWSLFRAEAFEWVGGWRQGSGLLVWGGLLGVALWLPQQPMVPAGAVLGWTLWTLQCYGPPEPPEMLLTAAREVVPFLRRRLLLLWTYYLLTAAPLLVVMGLGPATWVGAAGLLLWSLLVLGLGLLAKYAFYPNATLSRLTQVGVVALAMLLVLNTAYAAMLVAALPVLLIKSRRRLSAFCYD